MATTQVIDLTNYRQQVSDKVPEGAYHGIVDDVQSTKTKTGDPMIVVWVRIVDGEYAGATIIDRMTLSERAVFRVVGFMQAIGLATPKKRLQVNLDRWKGKHVMMNVKDGEPFRGNINSEVASWERHVAVGGGQSAPDLADLDDIGAEEEDFDSRDAGAVSESTADDPIEDEGVTEAPAEEERGDLPSEDEDAPLDLDDIEI